MVVRKTKGLRDVLNDTKNLVRLVGSCDNVETFLYKVNENYGTEYTITEVRRCFRENSLGLTRGNLKIETFGDYLKYLKDYNGVMEKSRARPSSRSKESRRLSRLGNPHKTKSNGHHGSLHTRAFMSSNQEST